MSQEPAFGATHPLIHSSMGRYQLQIRLGEKPFIEAPDVSALRVEVLQRIEELEQTELKQQEALAELSKIAKDYGLPLDTRPLRLLS